MSTNVQMRFLLGSKFLLVWPEGSITSLLHQLLPVSGRVVVVAVPQVKPHGLDRGEDDDQDQELDGDHGRVDRHCREGDREIETERETNPILDTGFSVRLFECPSAKLAASQLDSENV